MSLRPGTIGICPPGALGVSFFFHLTHQLQNMDGRVSFIGLDGSRSTAELRKNTLKLSVDGVLHSFTGSTLITDSLSSAHRENKVPEVLLICPNPDQLLHVISSLVVLLEQQAESGPLQVEMLDFPTVVLSSNGIYFQRIRQMFVEKLEESTLYGRLPDLWPDLMPAIVGRLLRGVTIQTGLREGGGANTLYRPGPKGISRLAGGDPAIRKRCAELLSSRGAWFEMASNSSPTRLEFDKGIINLVSNFTGLIHAFQDDGSFVPLRVDQILVAENMAEVERLGSEVFRVGQCVKAYAAGDVCEEVVANCLHLCRTKSSHVPSSLQWVDLSIRQGTLTAAFTPTEEWLITPLIKYAQSAGLSTTEAYFEHLRVKLLDKLVLGVAKMNADREKNQHSHSHE